MYKRLLAVMLSLLMILVLFAFCSEQKIKNTKADAASYTVKTEWENTNTQNKDYIKWVDFKVSASALNKAYNYDVSTLESENHIDYIELLALCAQRCGGDFHNFDLRKMDTFAEKIKNGEEIEKGKYYKYYYDSYYAVLAQFVGEYAVQNGDGTWEEKYGLKAFSPIGAPFSFSHYKDFGNRRTYGFARSHLGNDLMGSIGTPIVAVESGTVEAIGWNRYGGWRIGIRSFDSMRYYYYAHLRKNKPYISNLKEGDIVKAGDVIGYLGMTGYSTKENVNNINVPHLHFGMQLIFDEVQKDGNNEIWIDVYEIVEFLNKNRTAVNKNGDGYERKNDFTERSLVENGVCQ